MESPSGSPLSLTTNPKLDAALAQGWQAWEASISDAGTAAATRWLAARTGGEVDAEELREAVDAVLAAADADDRVLAQAELAELLDGADDAVAEVLWEGVLAHGDASGDAETIFDAVSHLATIAETSGDPLAAAEYHIHFLNWRRRPGHSADPELVQTSFDEVVRLAERDGAQTEAALYTYRQAGFNRLAEQEDERAAEGDWERDPAPYASWS